MGFDPHLPAELFELLAPQEAQHHVELLARRLPSLGAEVPRVLVVHRHESHLGSSLFGVQQSRVRERIKSKISKQGKRQERDALLAKYSQVLAVSRLVL